MSLRFLPALVALLLAGCGGGRGYGTATLWITHERGKEVVLTATVPAGETAMQALDRKARIDTEYGGRFVQAIDGTASSRSPQRDWFYYVNGIEGDVGAAEYRLRPGDVEWWDYHAWEDPAADPVVVGAFPEPFLHGYGGKRRRTVVLGDGPAAAKLARLLHAGRRPARGANVLVVSAGDPVFHAVKHGSTVEFVVGARDAVRLAANPSAARYRFEGLR